MVVLIGGRPVNPFWPTLVGNVGCRVGAKSEVVLADPLDILSEARRCAAGLYVEDDELGIDDNDDNDDDGGLPLE